MKNPKKMTSPNSRDILIAVRKAAIRAHLYDEDLDALIAKAESETEDYFDEKQRSGYLAGLIRAHALHAEVMYPLHNPENEKRVEEKYKERYATGK